MKNTDEENKSILAVVADKNREDNMTLCKMLETQGYTPLPVFSLRQALTVLRRPRIDLVVLDSGFDNTEHIVDAVTAHKSGVEIPIFMIRNKYYTKNKHLKLALN